MFAVTAVFDDPAALVAAVTGVPVKVSASNTTVL